LLFYGSGVGLFHLCIAIATLDLVHPLEACPILHPCLDCHCLCWCLVNWDNETPREYVFIRDNEKPSSNGQEGGGNLTYDDPGYPYPWLWCFLVYSVSYPWLPHRNLEGHIFCLRPTYCIMVLTIMILILVFCLLSNWPAQFAHVPGVYDHPGPMPRHGSNYSSSKQNWRQHKNNTCSCLKTLSSFMLAFDFGYEVFEAPY
jgi:hypothetical protein